MIALRYLRRRILSALIALIGVSILIFLIVRVLPGDPARIALGPFASQQQVEQLRERLRLDEPLVTQYYYFITGMFRGDLGISLFTNRPVVQDIATTFAATFELVLVAGFFMVTFGVLLGVLAARYRDRWPDQLTRVLALLGVATPSFVWAVILLLVFSYALGWFPIMGQLSDHLSRPPVVTGLLGLDALIAGQFRVFLDFAHHIFLPAFALSLAGMGQAARLVRANLIEAYDKQYVEMYRAYGVSENSIAFRWALKPALIPALTVLGLDFAAMLGNAFLVEAIFSWPGMARYGVQAILRNDLNAISGTVMVIAGFFIVVNFLVDLLVGYLNPQVRLREAS